MQDALGLRPRVQMRVCQWLVDNKIISAAGIENVGRERYFFLDIYCLI